GGSPGALDFLSYRENNFDMSKTQALAALVLSAALAAAGCGPAGDAGRDAGAPLRVVATTGMIGDLAARLGGDRVEVTTLMGPGIDPHLYKASESDVRKLAEADLIL